MKDFIYKGAARVHGENKEATEAKLVSTSQVGVEIIKKSTKSSLKIKMIPRGKRLEQLWESSLDAVFH